MKSSRIREYMNCLENTPLLKQAIIKTVSEYEYENKKGIPASQLLYLCVFSPTIIGFVEWVLKKAEIDGKNRIYFLSRDGYQMYLTAKQLSEMRGSHIQCRYLHVSRYSMRMPAYHLNLDKSIDSICVGGIDVTPIKILKRGGLNDEEVEDVLKEIGIEDQKEIILNYNQVMKFREQLRTSKLVRRYIKQHSIKAFQPAVEYLKQEGLCDDDKYFIVDSGWIGTLQQSIEQLVQVVNPAIKVSGCYFGMYDTPQNIEEGQYNAFYFSATTGIKRKIRFSNSLFETVISSCEGLTTGYQNMSQEYVPILNGNSNPNQEQMGANIKMLEKLLENMKTIFLEKKTELVDDKLIEKLLFLFMSQPGKLEINAYGSNLFSDDVNDGNYKMVAENLSKKQLHDQHFINKILIITGIRKNIIYESAWIEGSAARIYENNRWGYLLERFHIRFYKWFVYLRKQIKRK